MVKKQWLLQLLLRYLKHPLMSYSPRISCFNCRAYVPLMLLLFFTGFLIISCTTSTKDCPEDDVVQELSQEKLCEVIESAIYYTINFDLLTPPYDQLKEVSVQGFKEVMDSMQLKTGKRLGFKFQADTD